MVDGFFRKMAEAAFGSNNDQEDEQVYPANQDPYGDPADQGMLGGGYIADPYANDPYINSSEDVMYSRGESGDEEYYEDDRNERRNVW